MITWLRSKKTHISRGCRYAASSGRHVHQAAPIGSFSASFQSFATLVVFLIDASCLIKWGSVKIMHFSCAFAPCYQVRSINGYSNVWCTWNSKALELNLIFALMIRFVTCCRIGSKRIWLILFWQLVDGKTCCDVFIPQSGISACWGSSHLAAIWCMMDRLACYFRQCLLIMRQIIGTRLICYWFASSFGYYQAGFPHFCSYVALWVLCTVTPVIAYILSSNNSVVNVFPLFVVTRSTLRINTNAESAVISCWIFIAGVLFSLPWIALWKMSPTFATSPCATVYACNFLIFL